MEEESKAIVPEREGVSLSASGAEISPGAIAAAETARAMVVAAYGMAQRNPRDYKRSRARILEACTRPAFAERVEYSKPIGGGSVRGPSIRFAELALREWCNVRTDVTTIYEDDTMRRIQVTCTDLETNVAFGKQSTIHKTVERKSRKGRDVVSVRTNSYNEQVYVVLATEEEMATKEAAVISKVLRNEGLRLIPVDVVDEAIETAQETLHNRDRQDRAGSAQRVTRAFAAIGVSRTQLEAYLAHPVDHEDTDFQELRAIYEAIKGGEAKWKDYAPVREAEVLPPIDTATEQTMAAQAAKRGGAAQTTVSRPQEAAQAPDPQPPATEQEPPQDAPRAPQEAQQPDPGPSTEDPACAACGQPWSEHNMNQGCPGGGPEDRFVHPHRKPAPEPQGALPLNGNPQGGREF